MSTNLKYLKPILPFWITFGNTLGSMHWLKWLNLCSSSHSIFQLLCKMSDNLKCFKFDFIAWNQILLSTREWSLHLIIKTRFSFATQYVNFSIFEQSVQWFDMLKFLFCSGVYIAPWPLIIFPPDFLWFSSPRRDAKQFVTFQNLWFSSP